jgi:hypothetical protein
MLILSGTRTGRSAVQLCEYAWCRLGRPATLHKTRAGKGQFV